MNIEHIRAFLEVSANGSFQIAAEKLNVTQSTVSARIKALEERLNRLLFRRKRHGIELTTGGHQFKAYAVEVVRAWDRGQQIVALAEGAEVLISLGVEENQWSSLVPQWLDVMSAQHPKVSTNAFAEPSLRLMEKLKSGILDLAVLYDPQYCVEVDVEHLLDEDLVMVSTTPRAAESGEVAGYVFVDWGENFRNAHNLAFPRLLSHRMTTSNASLALQHIRAHGGSGYFLRSQVQTLLDTDELQLVSGATTITRSVYLGLRQDVADQPLMCDAIAVIRDILQNPSRFSSNQETSK